MTAETLNIENEKTEPRDINTLCDLPYSEMTDEEIDILINFKAEGIANDITHIKNMQIMEEAANTQIAYSRQTANSAMNVLNEMTRHAIQRYEDASNG